MKLKITHVALVLFGISSLGMAAHAQGRGQDQRSDGVPNAIAALEERVAALESSSVAGSTYKMLFLRDAMLGDNSANLSDSQITRESTIAFDTNGNGTWTFHECTERLRILENPLLRDISSPNFACADGGIHTFRYTERVDDNSVDLVVGGSLQLTVTVARGGDTILDGSGNFIPAVSSFPSDRASRFIRIGIRVSN